MKNQYLSGLLICIFSFTAAAQTNSWLQNYGSPGDESIVDLRVTAGDSVVMAGTLDSGSTSLGAFSLDNLGSSPRDYSTVLAKFDQAGNAARALALGGTGQRSASAMDVDASGNIYLLGYFKNEVDIDPLGSGDTLNLFGDCDIFLAKYSPSGNFPWSQHLFSGMGGDFSPEDIGADNNGNVYISGEFKAGDVYLKNFSDTIFQPAGASNYASLIQLNANNGAMNWVNTYSYDPAASSTKAPALNAIDVDASSNIYLGGVPVFQLAMNILLALSLNPAEAFIRRRLAKKKES